MKKSAACNIKVRQVLTICFCALVAATSYAADVGLNGDVQVTGNLTATSFAGDGSGLNNVAHYVSTVIVSPAGMATDSGADLLDALTAITDADETNPYLLKIEPGIYDIGSQSLQMKEYVDIEGSGEITTKITGVRSSNSAGVVMGASNAEIRLLTVENTGGGTYAIAIYNNNDSPTMTNVTAIASGAATYNFGIYNDNSSSPTMTNVTAEGDEHGMYNTGGAGTYTIYVDHSIFRGTTYAIGNVTGYTLYIGASKLDGGADTGGGGTYKCIHCYDENYEALDSVCQPAP